MVEFCRSGNVRAIQVSFDAYALSRPATAASYSARNSGSRAACSSRSRESSQSMRTGLCAVARQS